MPPYDEKTDIWKLPFVLEHILGALWYIFDLRVAFMRKHFCASIYTSLSISLHPYLPIPLPSPDPTFYYCTFCYTEQPPVWCTIAVTERVGPLGASIYLCHYFPLLIYNRLHSLMFIYSIHLQLAYVHARCTQEDPTQRPTMKQLRFALSSLFAEARGLSEEPTGLSLLP